MRHLSRQQAQTAISRGASVEQMLTRTLSDHGVQWLALHPAEDGLVLRLHHVRDDGSADFLDVTAFSPVDENEQFGEGRLLGRYPDVETAFAAVEVRGGRSDRWVNAGLVQDEYGDLLRAAGR